jgi:hypothetical protein
MTSHKTEWRTRRRRAVRRIVVTAVALLLLACPGSGQAADDPPPALQGKKFAAYEYGWYPISHVDHFDDPLPDYWKVHGQGTVQTQNGMITVVSTDDHSTGATITGHSRARGRWEIRMRAKRFESGNADFLATAELVPAGDAPDFCSPRNIGFASFRPTGDAARFYARNLPNREFSAFLPLKLTNDYWHTYGVEVTRKRISWFVDGVVRRTERRPAALSGARFALRLELTAVPGETMNKSRLQVDTVRYFTLKSKNKLPVRAPRPTAGTYAGAC